MCEGQGNAGKGTTQVYEDGTRVEGLGVWGETGEVRIVDLGGEKVRIWWSCSRSQEDCLPFHGIHSFGQAVLKKHGVTQGSWQRKVSSWKSGRIFSHRVVNNWIGLSEEVVSVKAFERKLDVFRKWKKDFLVDYVRHSCSARAKRTLFLAKSART